MHERSKLVLGEDFPALLATKHVMVFGLGGVGGHAAEALCRSGIGTVTLVDCECYERSNCNRQLFATAKTVGMRKTDAAKERLLEVAPDCRIITRDLFFSEENEPSELFQGVDYILDAIDTLSSKLYLIRRANELSIPIISCMGTGNKLDPTAFRVADIHKTSVCPLARNVRSHCRKMGIKKLKVVYSQEEPVKNTIATENGRHAPGSVSFVPGVAGMIMAGEIIKDFRKECLSSEQTK